MRHQPKFDYLKYRGNKGKWSSTINEELGYIVEDFRTAGFQDSVIKQVLEQQYKMLDKLGVKYIRPPGFLIGDQDAGIAA